MNLTVKQRKIIIEMLCFRLAAERDMVAITRIVKEFEEAFGKVILDWKESVSELLKDELSGYNALNVLNSWQ